jgi:phosphonate transport system permease protein
MKFYMIKRSIFDAVIFAYLAAVVLVYGLNPSDAEKLNLGRNAIVFAVLLITGMAISFLFNSKNIRTLGELIFEPPYRKAQVHDKGFFKSFWGWQFLIAFVVTVVISAIQTKVSLTEILNEDGFAGAQRLFNGMGHPNFELLPRAVMNVIETIFMAFLAMCLATPIAFVLSFLAAKNIMKHPAAFAVYLIIRVILNITRSIEALIWAIIFSVWVGIGPFAGMLALMIHSIASLTKQYSEMVETVNEGPIEGIMSTGANKLQVIWYAIVPQVILPYISFTVYRWDINVRMATIIGLVGGGGIGTMLIKYFGQAMWPEVGCIILVIASVVWIMDTSSAYIREALK